MSKETTDPADLVLRVLERKAFYKNRFAEQLAALYPSIDAAKQPRTAALNYLQSLLVCIPNAHVASAAGIVARRLVDSVEACPAPAEVRQTIAQSALLSMGMTFSTLFERARHFMALPPSDPAIVSRYIERLMYTTIVHLSREHFVAASEEQWQAAVIEVIFSNTINLVAMPIQTYMPPSHDITGPRPIPGKDA